MLNEHEFLGFLDFEILAVFIFSYCMIAWIFGTQGDPAEARR
jgi:cbb3-type cytochrome oxidase subunit 3